MKIEFLKSGKYKNGRDVIEVKEGAQVEMVDASQVGYYIEAKVAKLVPAKKEPAKKSEPDKGDSN